MTATRSASNFPRLEHLARRRQRLVVRDLSDHLDRARRETSALPVQGVRRPPAPNATIEVTWQDQDLDVVGTVFVRPGADGRRLVAPTGRRRPSCRRHGAERLRGSGRMRLVPGGVSAVSPTTRGTSQKAVQPSDRCVRLVRGKIGTRRS